ncbi:MAG: acyl-CoA reductase [Bacteroidota bacterium]
MNIDRKIEVFSKLGKALSRLGVEEDFSLLEREGWEAAAFKTAVDNAIEANAWFSPESVFQMLYILGVSLDRQDMEGWIGKYDMAKAQKQKTVALVMAGNIPAVGFHDFLAVIMAGHKVLAKLSSDDKYLIPAIAQLLISEDAGFKELIEFTEDTITGFDAVIATGSNNTSRYFNHYFGKYPHIIRKNRNALAVISGTEDDESLQFLGDDIFMYYGLGCRNVSKIYIPKDYDLKVFFSAIEKFSATADHHKYRNNYDYNKSIFLVNGDEHLDNGFLLLKEAASMASPVSVLHFERYDDIDEVNRFISKEADNIQCVISDDPDVSTALPPGTGQYPKLWDYADGVDTMEFLLNL